MNLKDSVNPRRWRCSPHVSVSAGFMALCRKIYFTFVVVVMQQCVPEQQHNICVQTLSGAITPRRKKLELFNFTTCESQAGGTTHFIFIVHVRSWSLCLRLHSVYKTCKCFVSRSREELHRDSVMGCSRLLDLSKWSNWPERKLWKQTNKKSFFLFF